LAIAIVVNRDVPGVLDIVRMEPAIDSTLPEEGPIFVREFRQYARYGDMLKNLEEEWLSDRSKAGKITVMDPDLPSVLYWWDKLDRPAQTRPSASLDYPLGFGF
jgi:hypothetical protein